MYMYIWQLAQLVYDKNDLPTFKRVGTVLLSCVIPSLEFMFWSLEGWSLQVLLVTGMW